MRYSLLLKSRNGLLLVTSGCYVADLKCVFCCFALVLGSETRASTRGMGRCVGRRVIACWCKHEGPWRSYYCAGRDVFKSVSSRNDTYIVDVNVFSLLNTYTITYIAKLDEVPTTAVIVGQLTHCVRCRVCPRPFSILRSRIPRFTCIEIHPHNIMFHYLDI